MVGRSQKSTYALSSNGLLVPNEFPAPQYESIHKIIASKAIKNPLYEHYTGAWNAIAYRFCGSADHKDAFIDSIKKHGSTPPPEERYLQERILFDFFSSAFSTFEAAFYGLYVIGAFILPTKFSLSSEKDQQKVSPSSTRNAYINAFPNDPILPTFADLFADSKYQQLREIRNILTHRTAPGRRMYVSIGSDDAPSTEWKLNNVPVDESIVTNAIQDLSRLLTQLLTTSDDFVKRHIL